MQPNRLQHPSMAVILCLGAAVAALWILIVSRGAEAQSPDLVAQGRQALVANNVDEALTLFEKAVAADPEDPFALTWLGVTQARKAANATVFNPLGWITKSFSTLDEAVHRFPNTYVVYLRRGITGAQVPDFLNKAPGAVRDLSTVLAMREKDPQAVPDTVMPSVYLNLGLAYKKTGQPAEARAAWEKGKQLYPSARERQAIEQELQGL
jgi:tetratricopeptide (TPR) repeat protein